MTEYMIRPSVATDTKRPDWCETSYYLPGAYIHDRPADVTIGAYEVNDGGDDVDTWATNPIHVQIDTNDDSQATGIVIHLNDGPPVYQGNVEVHDSAAEVLRRVRQVLTNSGDYELDVRAALDIIRTSGVVL